jgi:acyl carrier protein
LPSRDGASLWDGVLAGLHADALDCLQTTVALVADRAHGRGTHLALGSRWRFPVRSAAGGFAVQVPLQDRLAEASRLLGMCVGTPRGPLDGAAVRAHVAEAGAAYVVADAYALPWLPYAGHQHMPHSFLLERAHDGHAVVDGYRNDTEWGPARPGVWQLSAAEVDQALTMGALVVDVASGASPPRLDATAVLADNAARARDAEPDIAGYTATALARLDQPNGIDGLVLDIWLLARERLLHAAWLARIDRAAAAEVFARVEEWQRLAAQSYVTMRRTRRGGPPNTALVDDVGRSLRADAALAVQLAPRPAACGVDLVETTVTDVLRETLDLDVGTIRRAETLRDLPGFNSFRLVDVIERVERRLDVRLPGDFAAGDLRDVPGLCRMFTAALRETRTADTR